MFDKQSTTDEVLEGQDLRGKRVLVTGVSAGLGAETARALAARGAEVIGTARDIAKAAKATAPARDAAEASGGSIELVELDLASLASVRECADGLVGRGEPLHLIVANAGVMGPAFGQTADGFETQFGTNHLGHFVLVNRLAPLLGAGARVVILSSLAHQISDVDLDDPNFTQRRYHPYVGYGQSKTANALFAVEFDRRHRDRGVRAIAVHPGAIETELGRHMSPEARAAQFERFNQQIEEAGGELFRKSVAQGAATSVWAGVTARAEDVGGRYCEDCHVAAPVAGGQPAGVMHSGVAGYALDPEKARALWARSEELVGERF